MLVRNKVQDYTTWRRVFDENDQSLPTSGLTIEWVRRDADDPQEVWFCLLVNDRTQADAFLSDPANAQIGQRAGAINGDIVYLTEDS